ncbi:MAG: thiamine phosphate synthase [Bacteroidia bacterium]|nr:thiamine phosphate synthase [Bacteroidia bacterium]MDW8089157.1 thiamine phosphate synthase [Bacteroidia bacterium]
MLRIGRIHIITDTTIQERHSHLELARMAIEAGIVTLQYRQKEFVREKHFAELQAIAALARKHQVQLIINDHVALAAEVGATGVHLGETDMPIAEAMRQLPAFTLIGATVHTLEYYQTIRHLPLAYVGVGPVFPTNSKSLPYEPLGLEGLRRFVEAINHPVIAIGGITPERAKLLWENIPKLHGVAVLSAFCAAAQPMEVARALLALLPEGER